MTIKESLQKAIKALSNKNIKSAALDAEILLLYALNRSKNKPKSFVNDRAWLYAHDDYILSTRQKNIFFKYIEQRKRFEPIAYITGKKEFYGLEFYVDKNVLIPRPETEIIVEEALKEIIKKTAEGKTIVIADIGTGSGAIAISIAKILKNAGKHENIKIYATDISAEALKIAKINKKNIVGPGGRISFRQGSLWQALPRKIKFDFVLANLPYLSAPSRNNLKEYLKLKKITPAGFKSLSYEPSLALTDRRDGLSLIRNFMLSASPHLKKGSQIFLESDPHQIAAIKKLAKKHLPKHKITAIKDLRGLDRITKIEINRLISP